MEGEALHKFMLCSGLCVWAASSLLCGGWLAARAQSPSGQLQEGLSLALAHLPFPITPPLPQGLRHQLPHSAGGVHAQVLLGGPVRVPQR